MVIFKSKFAGTSYYSFRLWHSNDFTIFEPFFQKSFEVGHNECSLPFHITKTILFWLIKNGSNHGSNLAKSLQCWAVPQFWFQKWQFKLHTMMYQKGLNNIFKNVLGISGTVEWYFFFKNYLVQGAQLHWLW